MVICDNKYHILAISDCIAGNHNDSFNLLEHIDILVETMKKSEINYRNSHLNADAGFDVKSFISIVEQKYNMIANIPKNKRNTSEIAKEYRYLSEYVYSFRKKIETIFAWLDTYKRILIRFEYNDQNFKAWLLLASTMINLRSIFN